MKRKLHLLVFLISAFIFSVVQVANVCYAEDSSEEYYKPYINFGLAAYYANIPDVAIKYLTVAINETPIYTNLVTDDSAKVFYLRGLCYREELIRSSHSGGSKEELYDFAKKAEEDMMVAAKSDKYKAWAYDSAGATWKFAAPCFEKLPPDYWDDRTVTPITKAPAARERADYFFDLAKDADILSKKIAWKYSPTFIWRYLEEDRLSPKERKVLMLKYCAEIRPKLYGYYDVERVEKKLKKGHE